MKQQQKLNKKVLFGRNFICSDPFLRSEKRANITPHIQFVFVGFIEPNGAGVGFAVVWIENTAVFPLRATPLHLLDNKHSNDWLIVKFATALGAFGVGAIFTSLVDINHLAVKHALFFVEFYY
jgi:hypothetical protein